MPNSKRRRIADDLDDTSILYLVQNSSDSLNKLIRNEMITYSTKKNYTSTFKQYRGISVYKTWFAKKMKQDIDICVLSNVLLFMHEKKLTMSYIDTTSYELIRSAISQGYHLNKGHLLSSQYQSSTIILYHVARLLAVTNSSLLNDIRSIIKIDIHQRLTETSNLMEKVVLLSSLFRLGEKVEFDIDYQELHNDMKRFYWFKANPFYSSKFWIRKLVGNSNFVQSRYRCEAYYWSLVLELECLSNINHLTFGNNQHLRFEH